jgi:O-antigen/teichoic acid export membrane protein
LNSDNLKNKAAKGFFWSSIASITQQLLSAAFGIVLARILSVEDYGLIGMLAIFQVITNNLLNFGFTNAIYNKPKPAHRDYSALFWFSVFVSVFLYITVFFSASLIADFFNENRLILLTRILFISVIFNALNIVPSTILLKEICIKTKTLIDLSCTLVACIIGAILAITGFGYWALAIQSLTAPFLSVFIYAVVVKWRPSFKINLSPLKELFGFSIFIFLTNLVWQISNNVMSVLLGRFYTTKDVGFYVQGKKWSDFASAAVINSINQVAQPVLSGITNDNERQLAAFRKMLRFGAFVSFPLILGFASVAKEFIFITIGEKWANAVPFLQIFCLWSAFTFMWNLYSNLVYSHKKSKIYLLITIIVCVLQFFTIFGLYYAGMPIVSFVAGYVAACFIGLFIWQFYAKKLIGITLRHLVNDVGSYLGLTLISIAVALLCSFITQNIYFSLAIKIFVTAVVYIILLILFKSAMFRESFNYLRKMVKH